MFPADLPNRLAFGIPALDQHLAGGLQPGTLTVIAGATGVGKTLLGLQWAFVGTQAEGTPGVILDLSARGDDQNHARYAAERFGWKLSRHDLDAPVDPSSLWTSPLGHLACPLRKSSARHVTRHEVDEAVWQSWQADRARLSQRTALYLYSQLAQGTRRIVIDGVEPTSQPSESVQYAYFEDLYHRVVRQDHDWAAREAFRERFREFQHQVHMHPYDAGKTSCLFIATLPEILIDDLVARPIPEGDLFADATTILYLGRTRLEGQLGRALYVAKHRGSMCGDGILHYRIRQKALEFHTNPLI
jgi:RecA/RadA recombinase